MPGDRNIKKGDAQPDVPAFKEGRAMNFWAYITTPTNGRLGPAAGVTVICGAKQMLSGRREARGDDEHDTESSGT